MNNKQKFYFYLAIVQVILVLVFLLTTGGLVQTVHAQAETFDYYNSPTTAMLALSAAIAISVSGLAAAYVLRTVGTAAISAISEREGAFGKVIVFVAFGETIAIYGLIIAMLLVFNIPAPG
ncbi:MAG: ATP synthase subunit C [Candidatus Odinarchaeota archaeon]